MFKYAVSTVFKIVQYYIRWIASEIDMFPHSTRCELSSCGNMPKGWYDDIYKETIIAIINKTAVFLHH